MSTLNPTYQKNIKAIQSNLRIGGEISGISIGYRHAKSPDWTLKNIGRFNGKGKDVEFTNYASYYDYGARIYDSKKGVSETDQNKFDR